jgi:hypothetical protein
MADTKRQENIEKILLKNLLQFNGVQVSWEAEFRKTTMNRYRVKKKLQYLWLN